MINVDKKKSNVQKKIWKKRETNRYPNPSLQKNYILHKIR